MSSIHRLTVAGAAATELASVERSRHTATLCTAIVGDAATLIDMVDELIGGSQEAVWLTCMRAVLARVGAVADTVTAAHGGQAWAGGPATWLLHAGADADALKAMAASAAATQERGAA